MREIKFRGKRIDNGEWVEGDLLQDEQGSAKYIGCMAWKALLKYEVDPATVGQYTGLKDKNGVEIYEGDYVKYDNQVVLEIHFNNAHLGFNGCLLPPEHGVFSHLPSMYDMNPEVTGNIHDRTQ